MAATGDPEPAARPERREDERYPIFGQLGGEVMVYQPMTITELGRGGVQVETAFPLQIDSVHQLRLSLGDQPIVVQGRVTYCSIVDVEQELVRYRSGFEFVDLPERLLEVIERFVDAIGEGRGA